LRGLLFLGLAFALAIVVAVFVLARGPRREFWSGAVLTALGVYLLAGLPLRSSLASVVLFTVSLTLIAGARSSAGSRSFYLLPPLFLLWSNLDIQFVYGLMALVLFLITGVIANFAERKAPQQQNLHTPWRATLIVTAASFGATLCNPYGFHLWRTALRSVSLFAADPYIAEMHALRFRQPQDYVLLLLVMTAFFAIGRGHARDLYSTLLLTLCSIISFHLQRDAWLVTIAAVAVLSQSTGGLAPRESHSFEPATRSWVLPASAVAALVVLITVFVAKVSADRDALLARVSEKFPVRASDYIRQHGLPQPLFNDYDWGSFLTWYLPEYPVGSTIAPAPTAKI
jgi:hypothetical protein